MDPVYAAWIAGHAAAIANRDIETLTHLVLRSVELKAAVVTADEHEAGRRALLNAGHTVGHALEQASGFRLPHGEAVAIGLVLETRLAETMGVAEPGTAEQVADLCSELDLPVELPNGLDPARVREAMMFDKKNRRGTIHAAVLASLGRVARGSAGGWTVPLDVEAVQRAFD